jgi:hypothetical protein
MPQYLLAALVHEEHAEAGLRTKVSTKRSKASDAASGAGGDVEVREGQQLVEAYEVSGAAWKTKVGQFKASARGRLDHVIVVAEGAARASSADIEAEIERRHVPSGHDMAVVDLAASADFVVARVSREGRVRAVRQLHQWLMKWERRRTDLLTALRQALLDVGLASAGAADAGPPPAGLDDLLSRVAAAVTGGRIDPSDLEPLIEPIDGT